MVLSSWDKERFLDFLYGGVSFLVFLYCGVLLLSFMRHKAVLLLQEMSQRTSQRKQHMAKLPREILPTVTSFDFHHFTVENQFIPD